MKRNRAVANCLLRNPGCCLTRRKKNGLEWGGSELRAQAIGADVGAVAVFVRYAARRMRTIGKCLRPLWNSTSSSISAPGLPLTKAHGLAQGEPRGQRFRGSKRGARLAGRRW